MKNWPISMTIVLLGALSCSKSENLPVAQDNMIQLEVVDMPSTQTRAHVFNDKADVVAEGEFALSAYFKDNNAEYFTDAWVY